jgi:hypothetical protein
LTQTVKKMLKDETHAILTEDEFRGLMEYSRTLPTGQTTGKVWKRRVPRNGPLEKWLLGEYGKPFTHDTGDEFIEIIWREIIVV